MRHRDSISAPAALVLFVALAAAGGGCANNGARDGPRDRVGALPFPGAFTLYRPADPDDLGPHRYGRTPRVFRTDESDGIVYTTRAGFLDLAHVRITVDSVRFCAERLRAAVRERRNELALPTIEGSTFIVTLRYPPDWPPCADGAVADDELAIRAGQRLGYLMMTWHELITWFGYRTVMFIDESPSAFTYDDTMSHVVGLRVAGRALRDSTPGRSFDAAVTIALRAELEELGAVPPAQTELAARAVHGVWWARGKPLKRHLEVGLADGFVRPWLVPGADAVPAMSLMPTTAPAAIEPEGFPLPTLADVRGRDLSGFYTVRVDPVVPVGKRMRELLPDRPTLFDVERDFPLLMQATRRQMRDRLGADVDQPWPTSAPASPAGTP